LYVTKDMPANYEHFVTVLVFVLIKGNSVALSIAFTLCSQTGFGV
jgi:hypothetical protein